MMNTEKTYMKKDNWSKAVDWLWLRIGPTIFYSIEISSLMMIFSLALIAL